MNGSFRSIMVATLTLIGASTGIAEVSSERREEERCAPSAEHMAIVESFLPADFRQFPLCVVPFKTSSGELLLVMYISGGAEEVVVKVVDPVSKTLLSDQPDLGVFAHSTGTLQPIDLEADGTEEVIAYLPVGMRTLGTWVVRWNGTELENITPLEPGGFTRLVFEVDFLDLDNDKKLELRQWNGEIDEVYSMDDSGSYSEPVKCPFGLYFYRQSGKPTAFVEELLVTPGEYEVFIANGDADGRHSVTSAYVSLNKGIVFDPADFRMKTPTLSRIVNLKERNLLDVELRSSPGTFLYLSICQDDDAER